MTYKTKSFMIKKKAFTLIELLIVIAIIGILFIVLVSKVDFATDKAKATGVQTDFRSFQLAFDTVAKENAGFNTFGWDTGDLNANGKRDSYDEGDTNKDGIQDGTEVFTGHKVYTETFTKVYSLVKPGTTGYDRDALNRLETAINANLDPKLHISIKDDGEIVMANGAQDPWNKEYHGWYITNAEVDKKDRGAIVMYSDGANNEFGSEHKIANGVVTVSIPGNNKFGKDDYSLVSLYTYINGYGEVKNVTTGFSNNQTLLGGGENVEVPGTNEDLMECGHNKNASGDHAKRECGHYNCQGDCSCELAPCGIEGHWTGDGLDHSPISGTYEPHSYACQCDGWVIPDGGAYYIGVTSSQLGNYTGATTIYNEGEKMQCGQSPRKGDVFVLGDYEYRYNYEYGMNYEWTTNGVTLFWGVRVLNDNKTEYGSMLSYINGKPVVNLAMTFDGCKSLVNAPTIPETITNMFLAFRDCTSLVTPPKIPYGVIGLQGIFDGCISLVDLGDYIIPETVQDMGSAFYGCTSLTTAPVIPSSVTALSWAFDGCTSLMGTVYINTNNITSDIQSTAAGYGGACFRNVDMRNITLTGDASKDVLNLLGNTGKNWTNIE